MKKLILILIFIPCIGFANDDLTGKQIICAHEFANSIKAEGFKFTSSQYVNHYADLYYSDTYADETLAEYSRWYHTTLNAIHVHYFWYGKILDDEIKNHKDFIEIDRRTLEVDSWIWSPIDNKRHTFGGFKTGECKIYNGDDIVSAIYDWYSQLKAEAKGKNLL